MKNTIVRAFVVALAVAGVSASAVSAHQTAKHVIKSTTVVASLPGCAPGGKGNCGLDEN